MAGHARSASTARMPARATTGTSAAAPVAPRRSQPLRARLRAAVATARPAHLGPGCTWPLAVATAEGWRAIGIRWALGTVGSEQVLGLACRPARLAQPIRPLT